MKMLTNVQGDGEPLVLVGGGLTGWKSWIPHQQRLAGTRKVVRAQPLAVQLGLEDRPLPEGYSVRMESEALGAAIDGLLTPGPVDLVAWSYGAFIALDYALGHVERIRTLALIEPPAFWTLAATNKLDDQSRHESDALEAGYAAMRGDVTAAQLATFVTQAGLVPPGKSPYELPQWPSWLEHRRSLRTGHAAWAHTDSVARLRAFDRPVLLVKGTGSTHFLHRIIEALAETLPKAQVLELPGGHAPQMVALDPFLERLATFQGARSPE